MLRPRPLWIQAPGLPQPPVSACSVEGGVTTRSGGASQGDYAHNNLALHVGDDAQIVLDNRRGLQERLGVRCTQWLDQLHGCRSLYSTFASAGTAPEADAVWTDKPGLALAIMTADCVPVLVWGRDATVVGAAHAGWRGLRDGVIQSLLESIPVAAENLCAWIGPCISQVHYEVGEDVWSYFVQTDRECVRAHNDDSSKRLLNLALLAERRLRAFGVDSVCQSQLCTYAEENFYSYRRARHEGVDECGRMASVIMLKAQRP